MRKKMLFFLAFSFCMVLVQPLLKVCYRPVTASTSTLWKVWIVQNGCNAQTEGAFRRDGVVTDPGIFWGYPEDLVCYDNSASQTIRVTGQPNEAWYWIRFDWNKDGVWDEILFDEIVYFTGNHWSKTYTHSPETVTIGGSPQAVGGVLFPIDKLSLLVPYIALTVAVVAGIIGVAYARKRWLGNTVVQTP